jgi:hypothetical protein
MFITLSREDIPPCPVCGNKSQRQFIFNTLASVPEHFNHTVGGYVTNERALRDALKQKADEQSERIGMDHNYEYLTRSEMADAAAHGVTDEGLDTTRQTVHDESVR